MGDFNLDLTANRTSNSNNSLIYDFRRLLYTHNLKNIIDAPTRITDHSSTLIDLIITSKNAHGPLIKTPGCYDPCISDHHLIYAVLNVKKPKRQPKVISVSKCYNEAAMLNDFNMAPWQICTIFDDIDDIQWCWEKLYTQTLADHVKNRHSYN